MIVQVTEYQRPHGYAVFHRMELDIRPEHVQLLRDHGLRCEYEILCNGDISVALAHVELEDDYLLDIIDAAERGDRDARTVEQALEALIKHATPEGISDWIMETQDNA